MTRARVGGALAAALALAAAVLLLYAYRDLLARSFAADDFQWLLNVRGLGARAVVRTAFDAGAQTHFYRPLVWLLFWLQVRAFGLDPRGFHALSLGLHLLNAGLLGWLAYRLRLGGRRSAAAGLAAAAIVLLHPAPFEAVSWISAQSELLAALLLLLALHCWLPGAGGRTLAQVLLATLALGLALLAKESAAIGLVLLALLGEATAAPRARVGWLGRLAPYLLPTLLTLAYLALQLVVERRNYLLAQGGYGLGTQLLLNPLRSLALIVAPLPGTEHADNAWLVPVGALVLLLLLGLLAWQRRAAPPRVYLVPAIIAALGLTLLPTAPFSSPPDSRYLYLPVLIAALLVAALGAQLMRLGARLSRGPALPAGAALLVMLALAWWAAGQLHAREGQFAAGAGPGGSLWRLAGEVCAQGAPERMVIVEPPLAAPHAVAIIELACGRSTQVLVVGRDQAAAAGVHALVIGFPNGSATVERTT